MKPATERRKEESDLFKKGLAKCNKCGETKDLSMFYEDTRRQNGVKTCCKECVLAQNSTYIKKTTVRPGIRKIRRNLYEKGLSICSTCGKTKKLEEFSKSNLNSNGASSECKECHRGRDRYISEAARFVRL